MVAVEESRGHENEFRYRERVMTHWPYCDHSNSEDEDSKSMSVDLENVGRLQRKFLGEEEDHATIGGRLVLIDEILPY